MNSTLIDLTAGLFKRFKCFWISNFWEERDMPCLACAASLSHNRSNTINSTDKQNISVFTLSINNYISPSFFQMKWGFLNSSTMKIKVKSLIQKKKTGFGIVGQKICRRSWRLKGVKWRECKMEFEEVEIVWKREMELVSVNSCQFFVLFLVLFHVWECGPLME